MNAALGASEVSMSTTYFDVDAETNKEKARANTLVK